MLVEEITATCVQINGHSSARGFTTIIIIWLCIAIFYSKMSVKQTCATIHIKFRIGNAQRFIKMVRTSQAYHKVRVLPVVSKLALNKTCFYACTDIFGNTMLKRSGQGQ